MKKLNKAFWNPKSEACEPLTQERLLEGLKVMEAMGNHEKHIVVHESFLNTKMPWINKERYSGKGRPRKSDYDYKSIADLNQEKDSIYNKMIDANMLSMR